VSALDSLVPIAVVYATPLLIAGLGGLFSERAGVVNIALEGTMMVGGFAAASVAVGLEPGLGAGAGPAALLAAVAAGLLFSVLHAFASVHLRADQVVSGTALNILAGGLTVYLCQILFHQQRTEAFSSGLARASLPGLAALPLLGPAFFRDVYPTTPLALLLVAGVWLVLQRTPFGLRLRACGEHPQAAASVGIDVVRTRYAGVLLSGALAGLAGGTTVLTQDIQYTLGSIHGTGFIALACLIFGKWRPFGILGAALFFGVSEALSIYAKDFDFLAAVPPELFYLLPYALTVVALVVFSGRAVGPRALGEPYDPGRR
jgi:simple sugar transport system permease protein